MRKAGEEGLRDYFAQSCKNCKHWMPNKSHPSASDFRMRICSNYHSYPPGQIKLTMPRTSCNKFERK